MSSQMTHYDASDSDLRRFAEKVEFPPEELMETACWFWRGAKHSATRGYGKFRLGGRVLNAHKASYLMFVGEVPEGYVVGHQCNCESCVSPHHLEAETQSSNMQYCVASGRHSSQQKVAA